MKNKNIISYDTKKRLHGYCIHYINNQIEHRAKYKKHITIGYIENHIIHQQTIFHIRQA